MRILKVQYEMRLAFDGPVTDHYFRFRCLPMEDDAQTVEALELHLEPACAVRERTDGFGSRMCCGEILTPHDALCVRMNARVRVERGASDHELRAQAARGTGHTGYEDANRPDGLAAGQAPWFLYRYPSGLTKPDAAMREWLDRVRERYALFCRAMGYPEADRGKPPYCGSGPGITAEGNTGRQEIGLPSPDHAGTRFPEFLMHEVYRRLAYAQGHTHVGTTAAEAFALGRGVCQDYAHIYVTLCRMAGFPARYAAGMVVGEGATHAWAEVWQDGAWTAYDPTHDCIVDDRYVKVSHGRDFADCSVDRGCFRGAAGQEQTVYVKVEDCAAGRE